MLETVSQGFRAAKNRLAGRAVLTPELIDASVEEIRTSLLEADVAYDIVKKFVANVREVALGTIVSTSVRGKGGRRITATAGDHFLKICHDALENLMGPADTSLKWRRKGEITGIMLVGLQGSGKTTTAGKLAAKLKRERHRPLLVAADIYRPAAIAQLETLGRSLEIPVYAQANAQPLQIVLGAWQAARDGRHDVVIVDTAGRLAIDETLMKELEAIRSAVEPENVLLVADAMSGQDAVRTANAFNQRLAIDGFILTKLDGDARGGAALSIKEATGKPIKFVGLGEGLEKLEEFRPQGFANRILGLGDVVGLMKEFDEIVDHKRADADAKKLLSGKFHLRDFVEQIRTIRKLGPISEVLEKMPFFGETTEKLKPDERELDRIEAMYGSMTEAERTNPSLIDAKRASRIARGSGRAPQDVFGLLEKFKGMQQMMGAIGKQPGLLANLPLFRDLKALGGKKNLNLGSLFSKDPLLQRALASPGVGATTASGYAPSMQASALDRGRLGGNGATVGRPSQDRRALKEKRKREKDNRKKNRKR